MIYFGKDLVESERRVAAVRAHYGALCCWIAARVLLVFWRFRPHEWIVLVFAAFAAVAGLMDGALYSPAR